MMVHLIVPPIWGARHPVLSLARLKGFLRDRGIPATCHDWNLAYYHDTIRRLAEGELKLSLASLRRVMRTEATMEAERGRVAKQWGIENLRRVMDEMPRYRPFETNTLINDFLSGKLGDEADELLAQDTRLPVFLDEQVERMVEQGRFRGGDLFGVSMVAYMQVPAGLLLIRRLRERFPASVIVAGGTSFNHIAASDCSELAHLAGLDEVVQGPGEEVLAALCRSMQNAAAEDAARSAPLRSIGGLLFDDFDLDLYLDMSRSLPYQMHRHCYWRQCRYCNFKDPWADKDRVDIDRVVDDVEGLVRTYGARLINFLDNAVPGRKLERLARRFIDRNVEVLWDATVRPDRQLEGIDWRLVRESGCVGIDVGLESGSERILELMRRGTNGEDVPRLLSSIAGAGIRANVNVMLGFPGETREDAEKTIEMLDAISQYVHHIAPAGFQLAKGSDLYNAPEQYEIEVLPEPKFCFTGIVEFVHKTGHDDKRALTKEMEKTVIERFLHERGFNLPRSTD